MDTHAKKQEEKIAENKKQTDEKIQKQQEQIEEDEIKILMNWMMDRVSQDYIDDKYEEAL